MMVNAQVEEYKDDLNECQAAPEGRRVPGEPIMIRR
jgi:hypothetical protein